MFKKSLLIIVMIFTFNNNVEAGECTLSGNTLIGCEKTGSFIDTPQDDKIDEMNALVNKITKGKTSVLNHETFEYEETNMTDPEKNKLILDLNTVNKQYNVNQIILDKSNFSIYDSAQKKAAYLRNLSESEKKEAIAVSAVKNKVIQEDNYNLAKEGLKNIQNGDSGDVFEELANKQKENEYKTVIEKGLPTFNSNEKDAKSKYKINEWNSERVEDGENIANTNISKDTFKKNEDGLYDNKQLKTNGIDTSGLSDAIEKEKIYSKGDGYGIDQIVTNSNNQYNGKIGSKEEEINRIKKNLETIGNENSSTTAVNAALSELEKKGIDTTTGFFTDTNNIAQAKEEANKYINKLEEEKESLVNERNTKEIEISNKKIELQNKIVEEKEKIDNAIQKKIEDSNRESNLQNVKGRIEKEKIVLEDKKNIAEKELESTKNFHEGKKTWNKSKQLEEEKKVEKLTEKIDDLDDKIKSAKEEGDYSKMKELEKEKIVAESDKKLAITNGEAYEKEAAKSAVIIETAKEELDNANRALDNSNKKNEACVSDPKACGEKEVKRINDENSNIVKEAIFYENNCIDSDSSSACKKALKSMEKSGVCSSDPDSSECKKAEDELIKAEEVLLEEEKKIADAKIAEEKRIAEEDALFDELDAEEAAMYEKSDELVAAEKAANPGLARIKKGDESIMKTLLGDTELNNIIDIKSDKGGFTVLSGITIWIKDTLSGLVMMISIGALLYVGIRLGMARGNPEDFKKALMHMIYVIVGIFVISIAWATVTLVAGLNI